MTIAKFENRFAKVEAELKSRGTSMENSTLDEMDEIWNEVKKGE
jgi:tetrapyrrole methylase family protein/MazG family protein